MRTEMLDSSIKPKAAVLLSTFNGAKFLQQQLDSLVIQEDVDVQVFARDDGSTDNTEEILGRYAVYWPQLAHSAGGRNLGPAGSFLDLLFNAPDTYDFYAFCGQDDVWLSTKLARACRRLTEAATDRPGLYCSSVMCVDETLRPLGRRSIGGDASFQHLLFENIAYGTTVVLNAQARILIASRRPEAGVIMHDWWCALCASAFGMIVRDDQANVLYRQHGANVLGSSPNRLKEIYGRLLRFLRNPRGFYPVHAQAEAFNLAFGEHLDATQKVVLQEFLGSRKSLASRLHFALSGKLKHSGLVGGVAAKILVILGLY